MGTTRDAFNAGSTSFVWVAAIQGYDKLLCSDSTSAALTAWSGTDWTQALPNLFVELTQDQALDPDNPFASSGGSCTLHVLPDAADTFGIETARRSYGAETYLASSMTRTTSTVTVKSTTNFDSSGDIHIGTECIGHTGKTSDSFTTLTRGKYSPFAVYDGTRFAHDHRVDSDTNGVLLQPVVSAYPRTWIGRWVGVWAHRKLSDGTLDTKAQAELVFAGRIVEMRDDGNTGARVISVEHVMRSLGETVIGSGAWEGGVNDDVTLAVGDRFTMTDGLNSTQRTADPLVVVASGAATAYEINAGPWKHGALASKLVEWTVAAGAANDLWNDYAFESPWDAPDGKQYTRIRWTGSASDSGWRFAMPPHVVDFFGFGQAWTDPDNSALESVGNLAMQSNGSVISVNETARVSVIADGGYAARFPVERNTGTLIDQYETLPAAIKPASNTVDGTLYRWGLFMVADERYVVAAWLAADESNLLFVRAVLQSTEQSQDNRITLLGSDFNPLTVRQVYAYERSTKYIIPALLVSTGTTGYNVSLYGSGSTNYDTLPSGAGVPFSVLGDQFFMDVGTLPGADGMISMIVDRPTKLSELIGSDLLMRWSFFVWRNGTLTMDSWKTPTATLATATLAESNKAEPAGQVANQRSATTETDKWQRSTTKIRYNRDATDPKSDEYRSTVMFVDGVAQDDAGGAGKVKTINLRNTYKEFGGTGQSVVAILPGYMERSPLISRPANIVRRSIDIRYFLSISAGEVVLFNDSFARDPETGTRGIVDRPAMIVRHMWTPGGLSPGSDTAAAMTGEVELLFTEQNADRISAAYVPSGDVDDTYNTGDYDAGYDSVTYTLRLDEHAYSHSSESVDATNFPAGYKVLIIERDPLDATAPVMWEREVAGVSGSDITLTAALSSPAWDTSKKYRVLFQEYDTAAAVQKAKAYQADDDDGLILDSGQPFLYGTGTADSTYTAEGADPEIELVPDIAFADGFPRDVGHEVALARQLSNGIDYKSAIQQPLMFNAIVSNVTHSTGYRLVAFWPVFLSYEIPSNSVLRYLTVAPMARSYDGTSTKIKVSLWRSRPNANSLNDLAAYEGLVYSSASWTGITSTSMAVLSPQTLTLNVKHPFSGQAWLVLELGYKCQTYGISRMVEGARTAL
jgi:hypothetical protein